MRFQVVGSPCLLAKSPVTLAATTTVHVPYHKKPHLLRVQSCCFSVALLEEIIVLCGGNNCALWRNNCVCTSLAIAAARSSSTPFVVLSISSQSQRRTSRRQKTVFLSVLWQFEINATTRWLSAEMPGITTSHHQAHFTKLFPACANMQLSFSWLCCDICVLCNISRLPCAL